MAETKRAGQKIEDHLLNEGKRVKEKQAKRDLEERCHVQHKITNHTSEKYIIQKFNREFEQIIGEMFTDLPTEAGENFKISSLKVNYLRLKELLLSLGLISEAAANSDSSERALLYELWKALRGEEREEVSLGDVKVLILAILRFNTGA